MFALQPRMHPIVDYTRSPGGADEGTQWYSWCDEDVGVQIHEHPPTRAHREFDSSEDIIYVLKRLDQNNGHAIYISGEIERVLGGLPRGVSAFTNISGLRRVALERKMWGSQPAETPEDTVESGLHGSTIYWQMISLSTESG
jgi:hypothetical protein